ncbi:MAG: hypothetical protein KatS3mg115_1667 [Candidatus Poribacteria bacterium]|nr:MAG: hypothetical protein KatS3mg115_1667 [Candidatus Poribacteria bacterium]
MERPRVKLCGTTSVRDALLAESHGADYLGVLVAVPFSERNRPPELAAQIVAVVQVPVALLTWNASPEAVLRLLEQTGAAAVQLLGDEPPEQVAWLQSRTEREVWKSLFLPPRGVPVSEERRRRLLDAANAYAEAGAAKLLLDTAAEVDGVQRHGGTGRRERLGGLPPASIRRFPLPTFLGRGYPAGERRRGLPHCSALRNRFVQRSGAPPRPPRPGADGGAL